MPYPKTNKRPRIEEDNDEISKIYKILLQEKIELKKLGKSLSPDKAYKFKKANDALNQRKNRVRKKEENTRLEQRAKQLKEQIAELKKEAARLQAENSVIKDGNNYLSGLISKGPSFVNNLNPNMPVNNSVSTSDGNLPTSITSLSKPPTQ